MDNSFSPAKKTAMYVIAIVPWFALAAQFYLILQTTNETGYSNLKTITNFFSYFTILSNLLIAIWLTSSLLSPSSRLGSFLSKIPVQSAIALYIFIVGLVYNLVLRGLVTLRALTDSG
jgi:nitrate/nitrite-specific signal transduction histidine kinase